MAVTRVHEEPRVTKPYSDADWLAIDALGERVDAELLAQDVRLTQGGEPTFVSIDDMDGEEWSTAALSPKKWELAAALVRRLGARLAPGWLLHVGQGKWYPGEPLPRWALGIHWRTDGMPMWRDPKLLASEGADLRHTAADARAFATGLARHLGLHPGYTIPAYEDPWAAAFAEESLPRNVDPLEANLDDPAERRRLTRILERGLGEPAGYVLPIKPLLARRRPAARDDSTVRWRSSRWPLRREHLYLIPGDSPLGFRLPLSTLPWKLPEDMELEFPPDPFAEHPPLADPHAAVAASGDVAPPDDDPEPRAVVHTALCVEARDGALHVFLPPLDHAEHFLALVAAIERTAAVLRMPVTIEGYPPPADPRLCGFAITPDPGVIEVNIQPAATGTSWWTARRRSTTRRGSRGWAPRSSCSTAATPAPAAATTSSLGGADAGRQSAACGGPTCCAA